MLISLGRLHGVQEDDIFHIYSEEEGSDSCNIVKDTESYLATGTDVDTSDNISMLKINANGVGKVQGGDIVEFDPLLILYQEGKKSILKSISYRWAVYHLKFLFIL